ncbi:MAG: HEPN domain-containing protein [Acidobacteriota bacterium]
MKEETKAWIEKAREDVEAARFNYEGGLHKVAGFLCQQAAEKSLKGYLLERTGRIRKIHDLVALGRDADIPQGETAQRRKGGRDHPVRQPRPGQDG